MQGFLRHNQEERALRKTLGMVYGLSISGFTLSVIFLISMAFLKPESNKVHRTLYVLLGVGSFGCATVGGILSKTTEDDTLLLAQTDYLRRNDRVDEMSKRANFDQKERERQYQQLNTQMEMATSGKFRELIFHLEQQRQHIAWLTQQQKQTNQKLVNSSTPLSTSNQFVDHQPRTESRTANSPNNSQTNSTTQPILSPSSANEVNHLPSRKRRVSLPQQIAPNRIPQLFVAGTRVGKTALVKACIYHKLQSDPHTTFFISACKRNDWFGLEDVYSEEFGHHHSISNGSDVQGIVSQVDNIFRIYDYRAKNLTEDEQKASSPVIGILDDWLVQVKNLDTNPKAKKWVMANLVSIANNGAGCNVTLWVTAQSANLESFGFLDGTTRSTMNLAVLGRIVQDKETGRLEGGYKTIDMAVSNKNQLFTPEEASDLYSEYKTWMGRRDLNGNYSIAPLALLSIGAETWFEELEDYSPIIEAAKKNKPRSSMAQSINLEKEPEDKPKDKFWDLIAKLEGQILEKGVTEKGLTPSDVLNNCSAAVQIRRDENMRDRISKEFVEQMFNRLVDEGRGRVEHQESNGQSFLRFWSI